MTKRGKKRGRRNAAASKTQAPPPPTLLEQVQCGTCQRFRMRSEVCWFCNPPWPDPCICDVVRFQHVHLEHELLERLSQLDYESIDETILLPTDEWPMTDQDVINFEHEELVGITDGGDGHTAPRRYRTSRPSWRDSPEYKAFLGRYPDLRTRARQGIDSIFTFFTLTPSEADVWSLDSAGYTREWIADRLRFKPGGVDQLLDSVQSKISAKLVRLDRQLAPTG